MSSGWLQMTIPRLGGLPGNKSRLAAVDDGDRLSRFERIGCAVPSAPYRGGAPGVGSQHARLRNATPMRVIERDALACEGGCGCSHAGRASAGEQPVKDPVPAATWRLHDTQVATPKKKDLEAFAAKSLISFLNFGGP